MKIISHLVLAGFVCATFSFTASAQQSVFVSGKDAPFISSIYDTTKGDYATQIQRTGSSGSLLTYGVLGDNFGTGGTLTLLVPDESTGSNTAWKGIPVDEKDIMQWNDNNIIFIIISTKIQTEKIQGALVHSANGLSNSWLFTDGFVHKEDTSSMQYNPPSFPDVPSRHPYYTAIKWAQHENVLQGYPDGTFKPDRTVNRAEFTKLLLEASGMAATSNDENDASDFFDVDEDAWYAPYVRTAKQNNIIAGYSDGTFKPNQTVNLAEALKMIYKAFGILAPRQDGEWYERYLLDAQQSGYLFDSELPPAERMSRKDVVWVLYQIHKRNEFQSHQQNSSSSSEDRSFNLKPYAIWSDWDEDGEKDGILVFTTCDGYCGSMKKYEWTARVRIFNADFDLFRNTIEKNYNSDGYKKLDIVFEKYVQKYEIIYENFNTPYFKIPIAEVSNYLAGKNTLVIEIQFTDKNGKSHTLSNSLVPIHRIPELTY